MMRSPAKRPGFSFELQRRVTRLSRRKNKRPQQAKRSHRAKRSPRRKTASAGDFRWPAGSRRQKPPRKAARGPAISPRQVAVRAQETAFQLITAMDRGEVVPKFLRRYAEEAKRPGRIADPGRFRELVETIRRESFLVLTLQIEAEAEKRFRASSRAARDTAQFGLAKLFHDEFYAALERCLDYSAEEFAEFCRDLSVYRALRGKSATPQPRSRVMSSPKGPFADRCGFLLDSPMLDQSRHAAAQFESEVVALASAVLRKVLFRRERS